MVHAIASTAHEIPAREPVRVLVGERVRVERRHPQWPAFVFVKTRAGEGWVPSRHLSADTGRAFVRRSYDTTELPTIVREPLDVLERDLISEWCWCSNRHGRTRWVPERTIELITEHTRPSET